ncbi:MAG: Holliday junction branch migration DNA helicase RuvB [Mycoplasmataceae bacterium]|nr:Holliday junction branch migration DNA helicase RuvB [Mycoplasmataceae bacterium]
MQSLVFQMQTSLRPKTFKTFVGQKRLKKTLAVIIESANKREVQVEHILLHGKAGIGKTSLASIIANEMDASIRYAQGPTLEKKADILSLFASIKKGEVIFIDEIHGINRNIEEMIYSTLEDGVIDIIIGPEGESRIVRMKLPSFTLIGATTKIGRLSEPLKDRFGIIGKLIPYEDKELQRIVKASAKKLKLEIDDEASMKIALHSKETPRIANNLLKRCQDFATVEDSNVIDMKIINKTFKALGVYKGGLNEHHIIYLKSLANIFNEKSASIESLMGIINESRENIEIEIEPLLVKKSLIEKSSRGRKITTKGMRYISSYNLLDKDNI